MKFPNDENGDILAKMVERGDDLSKARKIDFYFAFPEKSQAENFAEQVRLTTGLLPEVSRYEECDMWQATVCKEMIPTPRLSQNSRLLWIKSRNYIKGGRTVGDVSSLSRDAIQKSPQSRDRKLALSACTRVKCAR